MMVSSSFTLAEVEALLFCDFPTCAQGFTESSSSSSISQRELSSLKLREGSDESNVTNSGTRRGGLKVVHGQRIGFRARSAEEILKDGYKWRKYGKKAIKDSLNPRNYFRCATVGCAVKKRVQRDGEDSSYVITIYEGVHNHERPKARQ